jgi:hypothetical protein
MAADDEIKKRIYREIEEATVKIFVSDEFCQMTPKSLFYIDGLFGHSTEKSS